MSIQQALFFQSAAAQNKLYAWGGNPTYKLGLGDLTNRSSPVQVGTATNWKTLLVAGGQVYQESFGGVDADGKLWMWGRGSSGVLGNGGIASRTSPVQIGSLTDWTEKLTIGGDNFTLAVKSDGTLWSWGYNVQGELGLGDTTNRSSPVQVGTATDWKYAATGWETSYGIKGSSNNLYSWGDNAWGELGEDPAVVARRSSPVQIGTSSWSTVAGGNVMVGAITTSGTLWTWGYGAAGGLGLGDQDNRTTPTQVGSLTDWSKIACGEFFMMAVKTNGTLWGWGRNSSGQLGVGDITNYSSPVQIGSGTDWSDIRCGNAHTIAIKTGGTIWAWGLNSSGQLGLADTTNRSSPVQIGTDAWSKIGAGYNSSFAILA